MSAIKKKPLVTAVHRNPPTELEQKQAQELQDFLRSENLYESDKEAELRQEVLGKLDVLCKTWVRRASEAAGMSPEDADEQNARIFTFGSYRLGVHGPGADVDTLCVGPKHVTRERHFFGSEPHCFEYLLSLMPEVTEILPVPDAYVPILSFTFSGICFDMLYASLAMDNIPDNLDLKDNIVLRECDDRTVRSLNGCRVTDTVLEFVEDRQAFIIALKFVKEWATRRGIYSNVSGYLGGINWAILMAYTSQLYPTECASTLLYRFFYVMNRLPWPYPLQLCEMDTDEVYNLQVWDMRKHFQNMQLVNMGQMDRSRMELMPIITPAYPAMNSSFNVNAVTFDILKDEFTRGEQICAEILHPKLAPAPVDWARLLEPFPFFDHFKHFVKVEVIAHEDDDLRKWDGFVHSRLKGLTNDIQLYVKARPWPKGFTAPITTPPVASTLPVDEETKPSLVIDTTVPQPESAAVPSAGGEAEEEEKKPASVAAITAVTKVPLRILYFIGLEKRAEPAAAPKQANTWSRTQVVQQQQRKQVNLQEPMHRFRESVMNSKFPRKEGMDLAMGYVKKTELPEFVLKKKAEKASDKEEVFNDALQKERPAAGLDDEQQVPTTTTAAGEGGQAQPQDSKAHPESSKENYEAGPLEPEAKKQKLDAGASDT